MAYSRETVQGFKPTMFIGVGATTAFFTLRETYLHETFIRGPGPMGGCVVNGVYQGTVNREIRSFHHQNLSQDPVEAYEKALMLARQHGLELTSTLESCKAEMRQITRANAEEMQARREYAAAQANHRVDVFADRWMMENLVRTPRCTFARGKHAGKTFAEVNKFDRGYLEFMAKDDDYDMTPEAELRKIALQTFLENHESELNLRDDHFGEIGQRIEIDLTVTFVRPVDSMYGTSLLIKGHDADGHRFTTFYAGNKFDPKIGETYTVKATVKDHDEYKGENQTMLTRIAVQS
jgi:hypothetical protein